MRQSHAFSVSEKSSGNFVTDADLAAEKHILSAINKQFPHDSILSEESFSELSEALKEGAWWIIDPLDGTTNFTYNIPHYAVSIAFAQSGQVQSGFVYHPPSGTLYEAARGSGARRNNAPITCRGQTTLRQALVATGFPYVRDNLDTLSKRVHAVLSKCQDIRRFGACSLDLCYLASGLVDAYFEDVSPWDMAAGALIAREAGAQHGRFRVLTDNEQQLPDELSGEGLLLSHPSIFLELQAILRVSLPTSKT